MNCKKFLLVSFVGLSMILTSCQQDKKSSMMDNINTAWTLLESAEKQPETELSIPMGFELNCLESEYDKHCEEIIQKDGGRHAGSLVYLNTTAFGGVKREVRMSKFNYFSDPNTETEYIAEIEFIFDEFRENKNSNGGWKVLRDSIASKFDETWEHVSFNLQDADNDEKHYDFENELYEYWVRGNMAVEFTYQGFHGFATLGFYNVPKYGTKFFKDYVNMSLDIKEDVRKNAEEKANRPKIQNSAWDGSVYQVKNYLKKNLKDPDSYEGIEWSNVVDNGNGTYTVRHKYRARNSFGGMVIENWIFELDENGNVTSASQL